MYLVLLSQMQGFGNADQYRHTQMNKLAINKLLVCFAESMDLGKPNQLLFNLDPEFVWRSH